MKIYQKQMEIKIPQPPAKKSRIDDESDQSQENATSNEANLSKAIENEENKGLFNR